MIVVHREEAVGRLTRSWRNEGLRVGFVPTMGALHRGHLSLVTKAFENADRVVVSIFVNPTQFGEGEDLSSYPRTLDDDCRALEQMGVHAVFAPEPHVIYPEGFSSQVHVKGVTEGLCGECRPGHFDGVATVCTVLFGIIQPHVAVFGMKDWQQLAVLRRVNKDLRLGIEILGAPTVREEDGLALSSRNAYLSREERQQAAAISSGLRAAQKLCRQGEKKSEKLIQKFLGMVEQMPMLQVQYAEIVDEESLEKLEEVGKKALFAVAVYAGSTRLIDNVLIEPEV